MTPKKTLQERENELRTLLSTPTGKEAIQELASRYYAAGGKQTPVGRSAITYILVHERERGLISN